MTTFEIIKRSDGGEYGVFSDGTKRKYKSISAVKGAAKEPFDEHGQALNKALKCGGKPQFWIDLWAKSRQDGKDNGNKIDAMVEKAMNGECGDGIEEIEVIQAWNESLIDYLSEDWFFIPQTVLSCSIGIDTLTPFGMAGKPDGIAINFAKRKIVIIDCKADKAVSFKSYNGRKFMLGKMSMHQECNGVEYAMQLILYKLMLRKNPVITYQKGGVWTELNLTGFEVTDMFINWHNAAAKKFELINIADKFNVVAMTKDIGLFVVDFFRSEDDKIIANKIAKKVE